MPVKPKSGTVVYGSNGAYEIRSILNQGNMAWSLEALNQNTGEKAFLKYYLSPTPTVSWYNDYIDYLVELNQRLEDSSANQYCVLCRDLFEANPSPSMSRYCYLFQAYEFIDEGQDLKNLLEKGNPTWEQRKGIAKVFLTAMKKIHGVGIVHCDLKPENVQLVPREDTALGLIPRMIDMDRSIMEDSPAPWTQGENREGYVGTPGYRSPEHLRGETPTCASDVFTIGIILCELLCGIHPFVHVIEDEDAYKKAVLAGGRLSMPVMLIGALGDTPGHAEQFAPLLERCLSPHAGERPTCAELHRALLQLDTPDSESFEPAAGSAPVPAFAPASAPAYPAPTPTTAPPMSAPESAPVPSPALSTPPPAPPPAPRGVLCLTGDKGCLRVRLSMNMGKGGLSNASSDGRFCEHEQFRVERTKEGWYASPCPSGKMPRNMTMLNGVELTERLPLHEGDTLCLQGRVSGKQAMKLTISFS